MSIGGSKNIGKKTVGIKAGTVSIISSREVLFIDDFKKAARLLLTGLFTAVVLYPALHEGGHMLTAILLGGRVEEIGLLPMPNVLCSGLRSIELAAVGLGGMGIPLVFSVLLRPKRFALWYMVQLIKGISALAMLLSLISLICYNCGVIIENNDIITVVQLWPEGGPLCFALLCIGLLLSVVSICAARPVQRLSKYFGI